MDYSIRKLKRDENKVLDTFLYEAIFIPEGVPAPSKDIINQPELQVYVKDFGENKGDLCLVAQVRDEIVGAVWVRIMNDYGHIEVISQILCKHRFRCKTEQNIFKAGAAEAVSALSTK